jgi:hypothetical protein
MSRDGGIIGISDHGGWAVFVTVAGDGTLLDRRRVELVDGDLPKIPHHSEGQMLPLDEAVALVERVQLSVERHAKIGLDAVEKTLPRTHSRRRASPVPLEAHFLQLRKSIGPPWGKDHKLAMAAAIAAARAH